ncbi:MAG TPA: glycosyltransferase [Terriglobales bacterium]|jgi:colanic acid/amylovoran biosynthesis glycosyltransferase|nr:glycosyltransferase [Terriglobales bacterium]
MTTIAYIANELPSPLEPYVIDEITELRRRGAQVICCSGKRVSPTDLSLAERAVWKETRFFQPLSDEELIRAVRRLASDRHNLWQLLRPLLWERGASPVRRIRALGHTVMGAALAEELAPLQVEHIHAHHGYFASWMALAAARLLGIGFSFTLHGSDLLQRADLLSAKLRACQFCVTVSDFNRQHILRNYSSTPSKKIIVQRLGVDRVLPWPTPAAVAAGEENHRHFCLLSVGRLHRVKDYPFLIQACAALRDQSIDFLCWIVGEGPERPALERQIIALGLQGRVYLIGSVPRTDLPGYYRYADLVVMTSKSEGIPVVLMEAMAHEKLVLAPAITGIPELVEHQRTGFLYQPGSLPDFVSAVAWIQANKASLAGIQHAAAASIAASYNRQRNLHAFAEQFLARIQQPDGNHAHPLLQQVRLSV